MQLKMQAIRFVMNNYIPDMPVFETGLSIDAVEAIVIYFKILYHQMITFSSLSLTPMHHTIKD